MNIICKLIAVRYPRPNRTGAKSNLIGITDKTLIKSTVNEKLMVDNYDYVVVSYDNRLFVCEKNSDTTYTRRDVVYHPLMNELKLP